MLFVCMLLFLVDNTALFFFCMLDWQYCLPGHYFVFLYQLVFWYLLFYKRLLLLLMENFLCYESYSLSDFHLLVLCFDCTIHWHELHPLCPLLPVYFLCFALLFFFRLLFSH